jgi:prefoldin subunit 5
MTMEEVYKKEIAEMQSANHQLMVRIKELNEEINQLQKKLNEKK